MRDKVEEDSEKKLEEMKKIIKSNQIWKKKFKHSKNMKHVNILKMAEKRNVLKGYKRLTQT